MWGWDKGGREGAGKFLILFCSAGSAQWFQLPDTHQCKPTGYSVVSQEASGRPKQVLIVFRRSQGKPQGGGFRNLPESVVQASFTAERVPAAYIWWHGIWADQPRVSAAVREWPRTTGPPFSLVKGLTSQELVKTAPILFTFLNMVPQGHLSPSAHAFLPLVKA